MSRASRITDQLFTGADLPRRDGDAWSAELDRWEAFGITHVVDNRIEASDLDLLAQFAPAVTYLENGHDDVGQRMPDERSDRGAGFTLEAVADPSAKVHDLRAFWAANPHDTIRVAWEIRDEELRELLVAVSPDPR